VCSVSHVAIEPGSEIVAMETMQLVCARRVMDRIVESGSPRKCRQRSNDAVRSVVSS